uniref:Secreted protein n=1 Tax=Anopheles coluzzii TaxID=1518534 RepID=A0A8W7PTI2_ANOCL
MWRRGSGFATLLGSFGTTATARTLQDRVLNGRAAARAQISAAARVHSAFASLYTTGMLHFQLSMIITEGNGNRVKLRRWCIRRPQIRPTKYNVNHPAESSGLSNGSETTLQSPVCPTNNCISN